MNVIETDSCYAILDKPNNKVIKIIKPYWQKKTPWIIPNEVRALKKLSNSNHFPKLISYDENSITTDYSGDAIIPENITLPPHDKREFTSVPADFEEQLNEILNELEEAELRHSDINVGHLLADEKGVLKLIDFELCLEFGELEPKNYLQTQGIDAKTRNIDEAVDDRLMAHRTVQKIKGCMQTINDALGKLPNRRQYHELPFRLVQKADRGYLRERIRLFKNAYDFSGKKGLDLGCNIGGITFSLALEGAKMRGVDIYDEGLNVANACEDYYKLNCEFFKEDIVDYVRKINEHYDFCIFLATWHWVVKQHGEKVGIEVIKKISDRCDTMFFEINFGHEEGLRGSEETMVELGLTNEQAVIDFIKKNTKYTEVKNIGKSVGWGNRITFMCSKPLS